MAENKAELDRIVQDRQLVGRSGKVYHLGTRISAQKMAEFDLAQRELATGLSVPSLFNELKDVYGLLTVTKVKKNKNGDITFDSNNLEAGRRIHDILSGLQKIRERRSTVMKIACLYIVTDGEHPGVYNEDQERMKIADLETEYPYEDFFQLATIGLEKLISNLNRLSQLGSEIPMVDAD